MATYKYNPLLPKGLELQQDALGGTLDTVTTAGAITDNDITVGEITTSKVVVSSGLNTQILHADGSLEENRFDAIDEPTAVTLALTSIPLVDRWIGRKVLCNNVEYTFVEGVLDDNFVKEKFEIQPIINGNRTSNVNFEYGYTSVPVDISANLYSYKSIKYNKGARLATSLANNTLYHEIVQSPVIESADRVKLYENSIDIKRGCHVNTLFSFLSNPKRRTYITGVANTERGTINEITQFEALDARMATLNTSFLSRSVQSIENTIISVNRVSATPYPRATVTTATNHNYALGETVQVVEPILGLPKVSINTISWQRVTNIVTLNVASHTFLAGDIVTVATLNITGLITSVTSTTILLENHGTDVPLTNAVYSISHRNWVVITTVTANTFGFTNAGSVISATTTTGTVTPATVWNYRASGNAPNSFVGKTYIGTETRTLTLASCELRAGTNVLGYAAADAHPSYFGRNGHFGNTVLTTPTVTVPDINVISEGAMVFGNTTTPATTSKGIVKFDSTTNQLSFSDGTKYFKVNEERVKFFFEGNIGNLSLTKLDSVGEVNTLMSSAVYINKATEISEIYFIIGSVAAGQTSGQITVTLQHVALGQTLEIDAATAGTTVATATYNFVNGVANSRYVKNTLSSITGSIPADRMLFAKIQTTSPFNGGANAVQDIVVTVKLR